MEYCYTYYLFKSLSRYIIYSNIIKTKNHITFFLKLLIDIKMTAMENESSDGNVSPKKKLIRKGKTALARVLLLDGSYLDLQINVSMIKFRYL